VGARWVKWKQIIPWERLDVNLPEKGTAFTDLIRVKWKQEILWERSIGGPRSNEVFQWTLVVINHGIRSIGASPPVSRFVGRTTWESIVAKQELSKQAWAIRSNKLWTLQYTRSKPRRVIDLEMPQILYGVPVVGTGLSASVISGTGYTAFKYIYIYIYIYIYMYL
jgi:hypothetical protein